MIINKIVTKTQIDRGHVLAKGQKDELIWSEKVGKL